MAGTTLRNFTPEGTVSISATTSSGNVALSPSPLNHKDVLLYNSGTTLAFVKFGSSNTVTAAATDMPLPPGAMLLVFARDATWVAAIMASGTATIYATSGFGN